MPHRFETTQGILIDRFIDAALDQHRHSAIVELDAAAGAQHGARLVCGVERPALADMLAGPETLQVAKEPTLHCAAHITTEVTFAQFG